MTELRLDVYGVDNEGLPDLSGQPYTIQHAWGRSFRDIRNEPGSAAFAVDLESPDWDQIRWNRVVRFLVRDPGFGWETRGAGIIRDQPPTLVRGSVGTPEGWSALVRLDGLLSWLGYARGGAVMYPQGGLSGLQLNPRGWGWKYVDYDDSAWGSPVSLGEYRNPTHPSLKGGEGDPGQHEIQRVVLDVDHPPFPWGSSYPSTGPQQLQGTWNLTFNGRRTGAIQWNVNAAGVKAALESLPNCDGVSVTGSGTSGSPWVVTFNGGNVANKMHNLMTITHNDLRHNHATTRVTRQQAGSVAVKGEELIEGWPDPRAHWFGEFGVTQHYRRVLDIEAEPEKAGEAFILLVTMGRRPAEVFLDGADVATVGRRTIVKIPIELEFGQHLLAFKANGPTMVSIVTEDEETGKYNGVLFRSNTSSAWKVYGPATPPGVTRGFVMRRCVLESWSRGEIPWVNTNWNTSLDSSGSAWTRRVMHAFRVQELGRLDDDVRAAMGGGVIRMTPTGTLQLYEELGVNRTGTITIQQPFEATGTGEGPRYTRVLYETENGFGTAEMDTDDLEQEYGVMAKFLQFGTGLEPEDLFGAVRANLSEAIRPYEEWLVAPPDNVIAYRHANIGDLVTMTGPNGTFPVRIVEFHLVDTDETQRPEWSWRVVRHYA